MAPRALGALLALAAVVAFAVSIATSAWWAGHPVVEGRPITAKDVHVGLLGAEGCNTGGDGSCEPVQIGTTFKLATYGELAVVGLTALLALALAISTWTVGDRRKGLARATMLFAVLAGAGGGVVLALGPAIKASQRVDVPIGWGLYVFGGAIAASLIGGAIARTVEREPLRLKPSKAPLQPSANVRDMLRDQRDGMLHPGSRKSDPRLGHDSGRESVPLFGSAPQLRPLYDLNNQGVVPVPPPPALPLHMPTPLPQQAINALTGMPTPVPRNVNPPADPFAQTPDPFGETEFQQQAPRAESEPIEPPPPLGPPSRGPTSPPLGPTPPRMAPSTDPPRTSPSTSPPPRTNPPTNSPSRTSPPSNPPRTSPPTTPPRTSPPTTPPRTSPPTTPPRTSPATNPPSGSSSPSTPPRTSSPTNPPAGSPSNPARTSPPTNPPPSSMPPARPKLPSLPPLGPRPSSPTSPPSGPKTTTMPPPAGPKPQTAGAAPPPSIETVQSRSGKKVTVPPPARTTPQPRTAQPTLANAVPPMPAADNHPPQDERSATDTDAERELGDRTDAGVEPASAASDAPPTDSLAPSRPSDITDPSGSDDAPADATDQTKPPEGMIERNPKAQTPLAPPPVAKPPVEVAEAAAVPQAVQIPISTAPSTLPPPKQTTETTSGPTPACPQCEAPMAWVDEHLRFYCKSCRMYF